MTSIHCFDSMWLSPPRSPTFSTNEQRTASLTRTGWPVTTAMPPAPKGAGVSIWEFATTSDQPSAILRNLQCPGDMHAQRSVMHLAVRRKSQTMYFLGLFTLHEIAIRRSAWLLLGTVVVLGPVDR